MKLKINSFKGFIFGIFFLINWSYTIAAVAPNSDSISVNEFNRYSTNEAKMSLLFQNELPIVYDFVKKHPAIYDTFSKNINKGQNGQLKYQLNLMVVIAILSSKQIPKSCSNFFKPFKSKKLYQSK